MLFASSFFSISLSQITGYFLSILFIVLLIIYEIAGAKQKTKNTRKLLLPYVILLGTIFLYTILKDYIIKL